MAARIKGRGRRRRKRLCGCGFYPAESQMYRKLGTKGTRKKVAFNLKSIGGRGKRTRRMR